MNTLMWLKVCWYVKQYNFGIIKMCCKKKMNDFGYRIISLII